MLSVRRPFYFVLVAASCWLQTANAQKFSAIVAFGDSLSDLGNTANYLSEVSLYFAGYNTYYYDQGRWSDGPVWIEDLARLLGFSAPQRNDGTNLYGTDFAWGGSTSAGGYTTFTELPGAYLPNLHTQIENYIELLSTRDTRMPKPSETLFSVWSGGNDVIYWVQNGPAYKTYTTPQKILSHITSAIETLYDLGGRYFLIPNLPPLGDKPNFRVNPAWEQQANAFASQYKALLHTQLEVLSQTLGGVTIVEFDVYDLFLTVLQHPPDGITNTTGTAFIWDDWAPHGGKIVPNPDQYLFWDGTHPTLVGHEIVAKSAYEQIQKTFRAVLGSTNSP